MKTPFERLRMATSRSAGVGAALLFAACATPTTTQTTSATPTRSSTMSSIVNIPKVSLKRVQADGVDVFYREAGPADAPVILLMHGFPASSHMFRELMPRLAGR